MLKTHVPSVPVSIRRKVVIVDRYSEYEVSKKEFRSDEHAIFHETMSEQRTAVTKWLQDVREDNGMDSDTPLDY